MRLEIRRRRLMVSDWLHTHIERHLRAVTRLVDWEQQKQRFSALREQLSL